MSKTKKEKAPQSEVDGDAPNSENGRPEKRAEKRKEKRERVVEELAREADGLREAVSEMVESYRFKVEGQLAEIATAARGTVRLGGEPDPLRLSVAEKMLSTIKKTELKPKKGRAKDFQRLESLVEELTALLPGEK